MSDVSAPQPGWYADPENPAGERWWNGSGWSEHKRSSTDTATAGYVGPGTVPPPPVTPGAVAPDATAPSAVPVPPAPVAESAGFTYGIPAPSTSDSRPDPYAPPAQGVAQPYYSSPYVGAPYGAPAYGSSINGLALAGLITSAVGWFIIPLLAPIAGIILSAFGLRQAKVREAAGNPNPGRGLAMAGLIVGIVIGGFTVLAITIAIVGSIASYSATFG